MKRKSKQPAGGERARDERRDRKTARYGGGPWAVADERGDKRFGHARNDDANPSELAPRAAETGDSGSPGAVDPGIAAAEDTGGTVSGGEIAGMRRGDEPRKAKARAKPRARAAKAKKTSHPRRRRNKVNK